MPRLGNGRCQTLVTDLTSSIGGSATSCHGPLFVSRTLHTSNFTSQRQYCRLEIFVSVRGQVVAHLSSCWECGCAFGPRKSEKQQVYLKRFVCIDGRHSFEAGDHNPPIVCADSNTRAVQVLLWRRQDLLVLHLCKTKLNRQIVNERADNKSYL
jgi:hypothetical protein